MPRTTLLKFNDEGFFTINTDPEKSVSQPTISPILHNQNQEVNEEAVRVLLNGLDLTGKLNIKIKNKFFSFYHIIEKTEYTFVGEDMIGKLNTYMCNKV